jgi:hypothetical protein
MAVDDDFVELIARLDPARHEQPPAPGSDRYRAILETATGLSVDAPTAIDGDPASVGAARRHRRRWGRVAGVAAASLAATGAVVVWQFGDGPTTAGAVRSAAQALGDVTSYEGQRTHEQPGVSVETDTLRVDGDDFEFVSETRFVDGRVERFAVTVVDGIHYVSEDDEPVASPLRPGDGLDGSYADASAALVGAALDGSDVTEAGSQTISGVLTTRYDIALTARSIDALSSLTPEQLAWFDLDDPNQIDQLSVWIADDHIHRIEIAHSDGATTRTAFSNLNDDITITPPPGPTSNPPSSNQDHRVNPLTPAVSSQ